jgi:hypothetical protein
LCQILHQYRFHDIFPDADSFGFGFGYDVAVTGAQDNGNIAPDTETFFCQCFPGQFRHGHVRYDQIKRIRLLGKQGQCVFAAVLGGYVISQSFQPDFVYFQDGCFIINK